MLRFLFVFIFFYGLNLSCVSTGDDKATDSVESEKESIWFAGGVEEAFDVAKEGNELVFLYWGAVWCPPCNELKQQVFSQPERAQIWGETFKASGYPTVIILDGNRNELLRLSETMNIAEFTTVVASVKESPSSLEQLISRAESQKLSEKEWLSLGIISWDYLPDSQMSKAQRIQVLAKLFQGVPDSLAVTKSMFGAAYLRLVSENKEELKDAFDAKLGESMLEQVLKTNETILANRAFITKFGAKTIEQLAADNRSKIDAYSAKWLEAALFLQKSPSISIDTRLWSHFPALDLHRKFSNTTLIPQSIKDDIMQAVAKADTTAQSDFQRHAVVSGAAFLMGEIEEYERAESLLKKEITQTNTPWYYQSGLARLAEKKGDLKAARKWSRTARKSAKGRATRMEWVARDILLTVRVAKDSEVDYVVGLTREFFDLALRLPDGFRGRNMLRATKVVEAIKPWMKHKKLALEFDRNRQECIARTEGNSICQRFFKEVKLN